VLDGDSVGTQPPQQSLPLSAHAYCGQTVAHLSNCWALVGRFYGKFNNILNVMGNCRNEMSALYLIQTYCLPSLLYSCSCETWSLRPCDKKRVDVAWNNAFRKIFNAYWHEVSNRCSIIALVFLCPSCHPWRNCWKKMLCSGNLILCRLAKCCDASIIVCLLWLLNTTLTSWRLLHISRTVFMAALWNRGPLYFCPVVTIFLSFFLA